MGRTVFASEASVVGRPSASSAQPSGMGLPSRAAAWILPMAVTVVEMSSIIGLSSSAGTATMMGLVPSRLSVPPKGATQRTVLQPMMAISPSRAASCA